MTDKPLTPEQRAEFVRLLERDDLPSLRGLFELGRQCADVIPPPTEAQSADIAAAVNQITDRLAAGDITVEDSVAELGHILAEHARALAIAVWERSHNPELTVH